jgi:hypothetical protein
MTLQGSYWMVQRKTSNGKKNGYQILMHEIARNLLDGSKENMKWQKMEWMKDALLSTIS